jgi:hypothetical protein
LHKDTKEDSIPHFETRVKLFRVSDFPFGFSGPCIGLLSFRFLPHTEVGWPFAQRYKTIFHPPFRNPGSKCSEFRIFSPIALSGPSVSLPSFSRLPHLEVGYLFRKRKYVLLLLYTETGCCYAPYLSQLTFRAAQDICQATNMTGSQSAVNMN